MAIQFARIEVVSRSSGGNACCKGAYNARTKIKDEQTNVTYNFQKKGDNIYHEVLLPEGADQKFKDIKILMNEVEKCEKRKDSQLLKDAVIALPDDKELNLQDRIEVTKRIIEKRGWVKEGLAVQVDIHEPHDGEKNWHAHLLITTRRFTKEGKGFGVKARDLNPEFKNTGKKTFIIPEETLLQHDTRDVINNYFKELGLENRVDLIGTIGQEHIGPLRMRSVLNQAADRNEERRIAEIEHLNSGSRVLDKVTRHMSVFSRGDLMRAVKCVPNLDTRERLVEDALANKSVVALFRQDGAKTQYFTTSEIRAEEEKCLRLSGYVANLSNIFAMGDRISFKHTQGLITVAKNSLTEEQHIALSELISSNSALRILRGRAGVGKSHVLCQLALIAKASNINVIGLAPTHKAKEALSSSGYAHTDTIKGMLFKLHNARFSLPKNSLLVVDEAGMIGNDDYQELLRVAATRKCNVILSGDERQLASVQRGGMFEIFADKYGSSTILDIKRQVTSWGKSVAMAFSEGNIRSGISILSQENRIKWQTDSTESMQALLADWHNSGEILSDRLILAVKNKDVAALNHGARQYLKAEGKLTGTEVEVGGNHYMKGDRILIQKTNKELGVINGDLGEILEVSKDRFVISMQNTDNVMNAKIIEFNPSEYSEFRHGYATTVFKAQGASIKDVYVFHNGFAGLRNSYVALSRNINELNLYVNTKATAGFKNLIKQLSYDPELGSSLNHLTGQEVEDKALGTRVANHQNVAVRAVNSAFDFIAKTATKITDKYLPKSEYYNYKEPSLKTESVGYAIDRIYEQNQNIGFESDDIEQKLVVGGDTSIFKSAVSSVGNGISNVLTDSRTNTPKTSSSAKDRFYSHADYARNRVQRTADLQVKWDNETEMLRKEACFKAESIAIDLLGAPNKKLSNGKELRFGDSGKIAVRISGNRAGTWYDFSESKGGDIFDLVQDRQGCDFKGAADYLKQSLGIRSDINSSHLQLVHDQRNSDLTEKYIKDKQAEQRASEQKQTQVNKLVQRSKDITETSIAFRYLANTRGISCNLGNDIKTARIYTSELNRYLPSLIAYARDEKGNVTGGQQILLKANGSKADIAVPKKSFGKISGSFVDLSNLSYNNNNKDNSKDKVDNFVEDTYTASDLPAKITIIAEGLETALSIKQALSSNHNYSGTNSKILCSLGIYNIKNYVPQKNEQIIIAADNDGEAAITNKTIIEASNILSERGAAVRIVRPVQIGDFNDILQKSDIGGILEIRETFNPVINSFKAKTLDEFFAASQNISSNEQISGKAQEDIEYLREYNVSEDEILGAFKSSYAQGLNYLKTTKEQVINVQQVIQGRGEQIITEARLWGSNLTDSQLINELIAIPQSKRINYLEEHRSEILNNYLKIHLNNFDTIKVYAASASEVFKAVEKEQKFLAELGSNMQDDVYKYNIENRNILRAVRAIHEKPQLFTDVRTMAEEAMKDEVLHPSEVLYLFKNELSMGDVYKTIDTAFEKHHIKTNLASFKQDKKQAKTPREFLKTALNEQEFLIGLERKLKYSTFDSKLQNAIVKAHNEQKGEVIDKLEKVIDRSINVGISTNDTVLQELRKTTDLRSAYINLDKASEENEIQTNLNNFAAGKLEAKLPEELIIVFTEEQKYLAELNDTIKYPDQHSQSLLDRVAEARAGQQDNIISFLRKAVDDSIETGVKDRSTIIEELKNTEDLKSAYINLDRGLESHRIQVNLNNFSNQKEQAKTLPDMLQIMTKEQEFLASLHNTIKYKDEHPQALLDSISQAHKGQQDNIMQELHNVTAHIVQHKVMPEQDLLQQLKNSEDTHAAIKELTKPAVEHHGSLVNKNLNILINHKHLEIGGKTFDCPMKYLHHEIANPAHAYADIAAFKKSIPRLQEIMNKLELKKEHEHSMGGMSM